MKGAMGLATAFLVMVGLAVLQAEAIGRLERTPFLLLRLAARKLPKDVRADQLEEWSANVLDEIYVSAPGMPLTRLVRGLRFATSAWWGARRLARLLDPTAPRSGWAAYRRTSTRWGIAAGHWSLAKGHPRVLAHTVSYAVAGHAVDIVLGAAIFGVQLLIHPWPHALGVGLAVAAANMCLQAFGRGAAAALLEAGHRRRWPARRIYMIYQLPIDGLVPYAYVAAMLLTNGGYSWWLLAIWVAGFMMNTAMNWSMAQRPEQLRVNNPLLGSLVGGRL